MVWLKFIICALVIFLAGSKLTKCGDIIAEKTGMCRAFIGLVLLAMVTSLPELANAISAAITKLPNLALGDILGACMINMITLAVLGLGYRLFGKGSIYSNPKKGNLISTFWGAILLFTIALFLIISHFVFDFTIFNISIYSFIILGFYLFIQKKLYAHSGDDEEASKKDGYAEISNFKLYAIFILASIAVVLAGSWLPFIGNEIVEVMHWGETLVAVVFIGLATTLPELTVSISALRLGEVGMAIGNLVGSNIFNISIIFIADIFYQSGSIIRDVSHDMIIIALIAAFFLATLFVSLKRRTS